MNLPPELFEAAREEFSHNGYRTTSIAAIAKRAGMAVGSVYLHCSSKYELFREVYLKVNRQKRQALIDEIDWSKPQQACSAYLNSIVSLLHSDRILAEWISKDPGDKLRKDSDCTLDDFYIEQLNRWREEGLINEKLSNEMLLDLIDAFRIIDKEQILPPETLQFLMQSLLKEVFST